MTFCSNAFFTFSYNPKNAYLQRHASFSSSYEAHAVIRTLINLPLSNITYDLFLSLLSLASSRCIGTRFHLTRQSPNTAKIKVSSIEPPTHAPLLPGAKELTEKCGKLRCGEGSGCWFPYRGGILRLLSSSFFFLLRFTIRWSSIARYGSSRSFLYYY